MAYEEVTSPIILDSTGQQIHSDLQQIKNVLTTPSAAEDITFDNTGTGMQADDVQDAITELKSNLSQLDGLTVYKNLTPQTSYADFDDGSTLPLISLTSNIEPIQDLHGYDSPWAGGAGKNKFNPINYESYKQADGSYRLTGINTNAISNAVPSNVVGQEVTFSAYFDLTKEASPTYIRILVSVGGRYSYSDIQANTKGTRSVTFTPQSTSDSIKIIYGSDGSNYFTMSQLQLEIGNQVTSYAPYSNECPISGHTEANVVVSPTTDAEDGTTYNVEFKDGSNPLTVYGGTLDVVSGVLTITDGYIASYNSEALPSTWISDRDVYAEGTTPTVGAEVVYKLATPQTYQLTPTEVNSLLGQNYIFSDTGNITNVKYIGVLNFS